MSRLRSRSNVRNERGDGYTCANGDREEMNVDGENNRLLCAAQRDRGGKGVQTYSLKTTSSLSSLGVVRGIHRLSHRLFSP